MVRAVACYDTFIDLVRQSPRSPEQQACRHIMHLASGNLATVMLRSKTVRVRPQSENGLAGYSLRRLSRRGTNPGPRLQGISGSCACRGLHTMVMPRGPGAECHSCRTARQAKAVKRDLFERAPNSDQIAPQRVQSLRETGGTLPISRWTSSKGGSSLRWKLPPLRQRDSWAWKQPAALPPPPPYRRPKRSP